MSDSNKVTELLAAALSGAAEVARARLGRGVTLAAATEPASTAILRFDLAFPQNGRLTWYVSNEDATGFADMLIGGEGDRNAVLTEMHLDALTVAFSDMLSRTVDAISAGLDEPLAAGEIDLGMEASLPEAESAGSRVLRGLEIAGFGSFAIVQQADADLAHFLQLHALADLAPVAAAAAAPAAAEEPLQSAGPTPTGAAEPDAAPAAADNVVPISGAPKRAQGDLDLLMNVPLPITVELGNTQRTIRELVDFSIGSIIELGKLAGDPLDIKVNDRVIARGEVVVIDEEFGIRVTEIVTPEDRISGLG